VIRLKDFNPATAPPGAVAIAQRLLHALALARMGLAPAVPVLTAVCNVWGHKHASIDEAGLAIDKWLEEAERASGAVESIIDPKPDAEARAVEAGLYAKLGVRGRA